MIKLLKFIKGLNRKQKFILLIIMALSSISAEFDFKITSQTDIENSDFIDRSKKSWSFESSIKINGAS